MKKEEKEKKVIEYEVVVVDGLCFIIIDVVDNIDEFVNDVMNLESLFLF